MPKKEKRISIKINLKVLHFINNNCCHLVGEPGLSRDTKTESEERLAEAKTEDYKEELKIVKEGFSF